MARDHTAGQYTRGWEVLAHLLAMAKASLLRHVGLSVLVGLLLGGAWFRGTLTDRQQHALGDYAKCSVMASLKPTGRGDYASLGGRRRHAVACKVLAELYGSRSVPFLVKQALCRGLLCSSVLFVLLGLALIRYGKGLRQSKRLRGARIETYSDLGRRRLCRLVLCCVGLGSLTATVLMCISLGAARLGWLDDLAASWLAMKSPAAAALLSADGQGKLLWYGSGAEAGFRPLGGAYLWLVALFGGRSIPGLLLEWFARAGALSLVPAVFLLAPKATAGRDRLRIAGVQIPKGNERRHLLFCGSPGVGKSTAIKALLEQLRARGDKVIVWDCSGEYIELFFREGRDVLLNPFDRRSARWTPWVDVHHAEDLYTLGRSLFPPEGKDPFWADAGAQLFACAAAVLQQRGQMTNSRLAYLLLHATVKELCEALEGSPAARFMDPDAGALPTNLLSTVAAKIGIWKFLPDPAPGEPVFSIRQFVQSENDSWLFISSREDQHEALRPLISLWCDLASTAILSRPPRQDKQGRGLWVIFDEVAKLQRLPALPSLLAFGRKHGACCVLGLQSIAQLRATWGRDGAADLASQPQIWLVLRSVEPETARWLEEALGCAEQQEANESLSMGADAMRDGVSLQQQTHKRPVALAAQISSLPDLCGYLKLPGDKPIYRVSFKPSGRKPIAAGFEPLAAAQGSGDVDDSQREERCAGGEVLLQRRLLPGQGRGACRELVGPGR